MTSHVPERLYTSTLFSGPLAIKMSLLLSCCSYSSITSLSLMSVPNGYIIPMRNKFLRFLSFSNNERKKKTNKGKESQWEGENIKFLKMKNLCISLQTLSPFSANFLSFLKSQSPLPPPFSYSFSPQSTLKIWSFHDIETTNIFPISMAICF